MFDEHLRAALALAQDPPSAASWARLCQLLTEGGAGSPRAALPPSIELLDALDSHLELWPDRVRQAPREWWSGGTPHPFWPIVRALDLRRTFRTPRRISAFFEAFPCDRIRVLQLGSNNLRVSGVRHLCQARSLGSLRELHLDDNGLNSQSLTLLSASTRLASLTSLSLDSNGLSPEAIEAFVHTELPSRLRSLSLARNPLGPKGAERLIHRGTFERLETLDLSNCYLGDMGVHVLTERFVFPRLKTLRLNRNAVTHAGVLALVATPYLMRLEELELKRNPTRPDDRELLLTSPGFPILAESPGGLKIRPATTSSRLSAPHASLAELRDLATAPPSTQAWGRIVDALDEIPHSDTLNVALDYIGPHISAWPSALRLVPARWWERALSGDDEPRLSITRVFDAYMPGADVRHVTALISAPGAHTLSRLAWQQTRIAAESMRLLTRSPLAPSLEHLELVGARLGRGGLRALASTTIMRRLAHLDLSSGTTGREGMRALVRSKHLPSLRSLHLAWGAASAEVLLEIAEHNVLPLTHLVLHHNALDADAIAALAESPNLPHLIELDLSHNMVNDRSLTALLEGGNFEGLRKLHLEGNLLGPRSGAALARAGFHRDGYDVAWERELPLTSSALLEEPP